MIHHVSIPAGNPQHVAAVLAELMGGKSYPFGPLKGAFMAVSRDGCSAMVECYPEKSTLTHDDGDGPVIFNEIKQAPGAWPFHVLLEVPIDQAEIEEIGAREGWRTKMFGRGIPGQEPFFHVVEFWIENRLMFEVLPKSMAMEYHRFLTTRQLDAMPENWRGRSAQAAE